MIANSRFPACILFLVVSVRTEFLPFLPVKVLPLPSEHLILSEAGPNSAPASLPGALGPLGTRWGLTRGHVPFAALGVSLR